MFAPPPSSQPVFCMQPWKTQLIVLHIHIVMSLNTYNIYFVPVRTSSGLHVAIGQDCITRSLFVIKSAEPIPYDTGGHFEPGPSLTKKYWG